MTKDRHLIIGIPGPWQDRKDLLTRVVTKTAGELMFAGLILACPKANDHVELELCEADPNLRKAAGHTMTAYLPEAQVSRAVPMTAAADVLNRFNYYRIVETPYLESGYTFSVSGDSARYRLELLDDHRHGPDELFHNVGGVWELALASAS